MENNFLSKIKKHALATTHHVYPTNGKVKAHTELSLAPGFVLFFFPFFLSLAAMQTGGLVLGWFVRRVGIGMTTPMQLPLSQPPCSCSHL